MHGLRSADCGLPGAICGPRTPDWAQPVAVVDDGWRAVPAYAQSATRNPQAGFTLIEMVVVMTLISLLLTLAIPRYLATVDNGRHNVRRQNVATMRDAIDKFYGDQGKYPQTLDELVARRYLREIPLDPVTETANWVVIAPPDPTSGAVYDVQPPPQATRASKAGR